VSLNICAARSFEWKAASSRRTPQRAAPAAVVRAPVKGVRLCTESGMRPADVINGIGELETSQLLVLEQIVVDHEIA
jgi:hypothetical protein